MSEEIIESVVEEQGLTFATDNLVEMAEKAEKRIEAVNKIKRMSLKVTNHHDWVDQNGKPYLQASGGEKVARLFGISWRIDEPLLENYEDGHFGYTYKGYFTWGGITIEAIGTRSSKDGFFKKYDYSTKDAQGKAMKLTLPPSEIDKGDVKKSAYTNCIGNGITRLLGIRNLTYEDLNEAGIDVLKISKVEYKQEEMSKEGKDMKTESHKMMTELYGNDYSKQLEKLTSFTAMGGKEIIGKKTLAGLSEKALQVTYAKIKEIYNKHPKRGDEGKAESKLSAEKFLSVLKTCETRASLEKTWNENWNEIYTDEEKSNLLEWKDIISEKLK